MADQSSSWTRVMAKYKGLLFAFPGIIEGSPLSPPLINPSSERMSKSPLILLLGPSP